MNLKQRCFQTGIEALHRIVRIDILGAGLFLFDRGYDVSRAAGPWISGFSNRRFRVFIFQWSFG